MSTDQDAVRVAAGKAVDEAKAEGSILSIGSVAKQIMARYPDSQLAARQIADIIARQAITAGVPMQFTDPN